MQILGSIARRQWFCYDVMLVLLFGFYYKTDNFSKRKGTGSWVLKYYYFSGENPQNKIIDKIPTIPPKTQNGGGKSTAGRL